MSAELAPTEDTPRVFAGRYALSRCVSERPSGEAYLGEDRASGETVFIKTFRNEFFANYRREAAAAFALRHPQIVGVLDTGIETQSRDAWIAYRFAAGVSLREAIDGKPWAANDVIECLRQLLAVLVVIHEAGWIHCDIKPDNVSMETLASGERRYVLLDLGAATTTREANSGLHALGSPAYTAPERFYDGFGAQSDLYSLGVLGFELATGHLPFLGDVKEIARAHLYTEPALGEVADSALREFLGLLLAKQPRQRVASARLGLSILSDAVIASASGLAPYNEERGKPLEVPDRQAHGHLLETAQNALRPSGSSDDEAVPESRLMASSVIAQFNWAMTPNDIVIDNVKNASVLGFFEGYARRSDVHGRPIGTVQVAAHVGVQRPCGGYVMQTGKRLTWLDASGVAFGESITLDERVHSICERNDFVAVAGRGFVQLISPDRKVTGIRNKTYAGTTQVALMRDEWIVHSSGLANQKLTIRPLAEFGRTGAERELAVLQGPILKLLCTGERILCVSVGVGEGQLAIDSFSLHGESARKIVTPLLGTLCLSANRLFFVTDDGAITAIDENLHMSRIALLDAAPELLAVSHDERLLVSAFAGKDGTLIQTREINAHG